MLSGKQKRRICWVLGAENVPVFQSVCAGRAGNCEGACGCKMESKLKDIDMKAFHDLTVGVFDSKQTEGQNWLPWYIVLFCGYSEKLRWYIYIPECTWNVTASYSIALYDALCREELRVWVRARLIWKKKVLWRIGWDWIKLWVLKEDLDTLYVGIFCQLQRVHERLRWSTSRLC